MPHELNELQFSNYVNSVTTAVLADDGTTLTAPPIDSVVANAAPTPSRLVLADSPHAPSQVEVIEVSSVDGSYNYTISDRALEGTTSPDEWPIGTHVLGTFTAELFEDLIGMTTGVFNEVAATETTPGISERASTAEAETGTDDVRHMTPLKVKEARQAAGFISVKDFGAAGGGTTDDTASIQAAIDSFGVTGGQVQLPKGVYIISSIQLNGRVTLVGSGRGSTVLKMKPSANSDMLRITDSAVLVGWTGLTIDGNRAQNTAGRCIVVEATTSSDGDSYAPYLLGSDTPPESYKHVVASNFTAGNSASDAIYHHASNYQIFYDNFTVSHCGRDGLSMFSSDGLYSNFYIEKNDRCGLWASGSNNKFLNGKVIWNGRTDKTYANLREQGSHNSFTTIEAQDSYTDGILILGDSPSFTNCTSNRNGYLSVGSEDQSTRAHADIRVGSTATKITFSGRVFSYAASTGSDGFWTTEYPFYFNSYSLGQIETWEVFYDQSTYNSPPNVSLYQIARTSMLDLGTFSSNGTDTFFDVSPLSPTGTGDKTTRNWRNSETTGACKETWHVPGTSTEQHKLQGVGDTLLNQNNGNTVIGSGGWNDGHLRLGIYHVWVDSTGDLRIKNSTPSSDTDGAVIGSQV